MNFFGKGRRAEYQGMVLPSYEENFLYYVCEMIGIQRVFQKGTYVIRPRSRSTFVLPSEFLTKKQNREMPQKPRIKH